MAPIPRSHRVLARLALALIALAVGIPPDPAEALRITEYTSRSLT